MCRGVHTYLSTASNISTILTLFFEIIHFVSTSQVTSRNELARRRPNAQDLETQRRVPPPPTNRLDVESQTQNAANFGTVVGRRIPSAQYMSARTDTAQIQYQTAKDNQG